MGTRAAAFTAKIHNLQHCNGRIKHNLLPLPSGDDVANTLKYFSQTLLSVLKDVPSISFDMLRSPEKDALRTALFPSLDYKTLHHALVGLVDAVPLVQHGAHALGYTILHTLACLVPFLEHELMDTLPYLVASTMTIFPISLHKDIIDVLCNHIFPFTFRPDPQQNNESYASMSTVAVLMMVFQYTDCTAFHCQVLECLMGLKKDIAKDLLCVIAHGTAKARCHAVELLFQYLPTLNPALLDGKGIGWKPRSCQREGCLSPTTNEAVKMCFEHSVAISSGEHPPPLYLCEECAREVEREHGSENMVDVLLPMDKVSATCEDPDCKSIDKSAVATCFSVVCAERNGHRPIRYCAQCVVNRHGNDSEDLGSSEHMLHTTIPSPWSMDPETQSYMVEAIVSLLHEAEPATPKHVQEPLGGGGEDGEESREATVVEERQLLSKYGIWLLVGLCAPNQDTPHESLGRLLSMLFQWFHYTACLPDVHELGALERLKKEYIHGWLMEVVKSHFEVFVSCLLPHPVDYAKVGGHWESWPSYPVQIKEGLKRLICLAPYDILTIEVWEYIMPYWMDALRHEAVEAEFNDLKVLLSKVLDPDLSPLAFTAEQMYMFLIKRFKSSSAPVQQQALYWLQILSMLEVPVPLELLYSMFMEGVQHLTQIPPEDTKDPAASPEGCTLIPPPSLDPRGGSLRLQRSLVNVPEEENPLLDLEPKSEAELQLLCYILMLDILIKQLELHDINQHKGLETSHAQSMLLLIRHLVAAPWEGTHTCCLEEGSSQCVFCEVCAIFFQLSLTLVEFFSPVMEVSMIDVPGEKHPINLDQTKHPHSSSPEPPKPPEKEPTPHKGESSFCPPEDNSVVVEVFSSSPVHTATVLECPVDSVSVLMPPDTVESVVAREITLTEDDVGTAKCTIAASPLLMDENNQQGVPQTTDLDSDKTFWHTTEGKFKFTLEELPPQLQLFYLMLKDLAVFEDADVLYHVLACLKVMCLHSEVLNKAAHNHRGFLIWCQENILVANLWKLLQMEYSHIAQLATSLLLHSITLLSGFDTFWKILEEEFHHKEWRVRFAAVEKVTVIAHFVDTSSVKNSPLMQSALAGAFCYLVHSLDDEQPTIAQRTLLNLDSIRTPSLKLFIWCLEAQFDSNITDRPMLLQTIFQIHNHLTNKRLLTWDFFLGRFDALLLEDQIALEKLGEISYIRDIKDINMYSEMFQKKLKRAHEALAHTSSSKSLTTSFGGKMPYKRAMSAPSPMIFHQDKIEKDKYYERQSSAPVLKRKSSRLVGSTIGALGPQQHFPNSFFVDSNQKDIIQEETHFLTVLFRTMDIEDHDKETLPLLAFLLMQFLARPDPIQRCEDKISRSQRMVLHYYFILLGYSWNPGEGRFVIPPYKVRASPIFSTFLMCMPKVLDHNFTLSNFLLTTFLSILVCCPSPLKYPTEHYPPTYSLWMLDSFSRHSWLQSTLVIMYKYHYDNYPYNRYIQWLILIVLNTLKMQHHRCKQIHEPILSPLPSRSRDFSTPSADMEQHLLERERQDPSYETTSLQEEAVKSYKSTSKGKFSASEDIEVMKQGQQGSKDKGVWKSWKSSERSCSSEGEDLEPELEAIPESPKSESCELFEEFGSDLAALAMIQDGKNDGQGLETKAHVEEKYQDIPQSSVSSEAENVSVIEKSSVEVMEKNIEKVSVNSPKKMFEKSLEKIYSYSPKKGKEEPKEVIPRSPIEVSVQSPKKTTFDSKPEEIVLAPRSQRVARYLKKDKKSFDETSSSKYRPSESRAELSRMKSLPYESYQQQHQSVCRSKTDSNILTLPEGSAEGKMSHSRYPPSKLRKARKAEILSSENLTVPIFRPPLERLLPIGGIVEKDKPPPLDTSPGGLFCHDSSFSRDPIVSGKEFFEEKGVQTGNVDLFINIPAQERLLPIGGPMPAKKDWYPAVSPKSDHEPGLETSFGKPVITQTQAPSVSGAFVDPLSNTGVTSPKPDTFITTPFAKEKEATASTSDSKNVNKKEKDVIGATSDVNKELPILELTADVKEDDITKPFETKLLPKDEVKKAVIEDSVEGSALGAMASGNFINRIFDLTPDISCPGSAFGVFDICKNAMDLRNEEKSTDKKGGKDLSEAEHRNSGGSIELSTSEKIELSTFSHENMVQKSLEKAFEEDVKCRLPYRQRKRRKSGLNTLEAQRSFDYQNVGQRRLRKVEVGSTSKRSSQSSTCPPRLAEDMVVERCTECGTVIEEYSDEEIGLCIIILATFVHREPAMAAPMLPKMLRVVAKIASSPNYPWQAECNIHLPGGSVSVARQFLRCTLHQLAPNGIFVQIFQSHIIEAEFYKTMASALADFNELNQVAPLILLFENLNDRKHLNHEVLFHILSNVATYLEYLPLESNMPSWASFLQLLDQFLRKILLTLAPGPIQLNSVLQIILCAIKLPVIREAKSSIMDPFSKILSHAIQHSPLDYHQLSELCSVCYRNVRERDKHILTRTAVFELVQALRFKTSVPDANLLVLVQFVLADYGGTLAPNIIVDGVPINMEAQSMYKTLAGECMQQNYLVDALEFVSDVHTLTKVKNMLYGNSTHLNEETLGGHLKAGLSQFLAIEFSKNNGRDNKASNRYLPWLYNPSTALQQGPKEFMDCVSHIRLMSWLLLGALTHSALMQTPSVCQPIPLEANSHIAEHVQVILAGFSEQSKVSVLHMSSLFHAFILCQLWTMYCEHMVALNPPGSEQNQVCGLTLTDFWAKVTPGILQLVCHSKLAEMVSLHFLSLMEALQECNSTILARLLPMWIPVLYSFQGHLSGTLQMRLQACISCCPPSRSREESLSGSTFLRWLQRLQFKMGQIELQSSTATQFYSL